MSNLNNVAVFNTDILQLFSKLFKNQYNEDKSYIFDAASVMRVLRLAQDGVGEKYQNLLSRLIPIIENGPKPSNDNSSGRSAVLIKKLFEFTNNYFNKFDSEVFLNYIPTTCNDLEEINGLMRRKIAGKKDFLHDIMDEDLNLAIIDESRFKGEWEIPFDEEETKDGYFYIGENRVKIVPMMCIKNNPRLHVKTFKDEDYLVVSLNYTNLCKMLIIKPNMLKNKQQLIEICDTKLNGDLIQNFIDNMKNTSYTKITMPKFTIEYKWNLKDAASSIPYLKTLLDDESNIEYTNLSPDMTRNRSRITTLQSHSEMTNCEYGTTVFTKTELLSYDWHPAEEKRLDLNSSFIFMTLNDDDKILNMGVYVGN